MPGGPPLEGPFSATFNHATIKASNRFLKNKIRICRACLSEPSVGDLHSQHESAPDALCKEPEHAIGSGATVDETVITPGFSTIADVDHPSTSFTWQDPEDYVKWWPSSNDDTLKDGLICGFTYFMDEMDFEWLQSHNTSLLGGSTQLEHECQSPTLEISDDTFELIMGLFEMINHFSEQFHKGVGAEFFVASSRIDDLPKATHEIPKFSGFEEILSSPLNPTIFISGTAPSWLPSTELLSQLACPIYKHWQQRKQAREGRRLIPVVERNIHEKPSFGYACFAPRPREDRLWWTSSARSASLPPRPVRLLGRSLSQMWDSQLRSIRKIREEVPAVNAEYAFIHLHKFCKDDVSPMVTDMQNSSARLYESKEDRKALLLEILAKDLKVMHDHENLLFMQRVKEYLDDFAGRTKKANATHRKPQAKEKRLAAKGKPKASSKKGQSLSSKPARTYRTINPERPPVSPPLSTLTLQNEQGPGSGRLVIRIGPSGQNLRSLAVVYINDNQDSSAPPTPSTINEVQPPSIADNVKLGPNASPIDSPRPEDMHQVGEVQMASDALPMVVMTKEPHPVSTPTALPEKVSDGQALEDQKESLVQTPSSPADAPSESRPSSVATAPALAPAPHSPTPITFGSKVHQNTSFDFTSPASKGSPTPKVLSAKGSQSAPGSPGTVDDTVVTKVAPNTPKAGTKKRGKNSRPPRKRARTAENLVNDENLPSTP